MRSITVLIAWFFLTLAARAGAAEPSVPDGSLSEKEYMDRGMPALDRAWTSADMAKAAKVLAVIGKEHPEQLPRIRSKKSGTVLARLADTQPIDELIKQAPKIDSREGAERLGYILSICDVYAKSVAKHGEGAEEFCELYGAMLHTFVLVVPWPDRTHPEVPEERREEVRRRVAGSVTQVFANGVLIAVDNEFHFSDPLRVRVLNHLNREFPTVAPRLSIRDRARILSKVNKGLAAPDMKPLHPALTDLAHQLERLPKASTK
jgi:hypothetical protein